MTTRHDTAHLVTQGLSDAHINAHSDLIHHDIPWSRRLYQFAIVIAKGTMIKGMVTGTGN